MATVISNLLSNSVLLRRSRAVGSSMLGDVSRYPKDMLELLIMPLIAQQIPGFNATFSVQDTACYGGPTVIPVIPLSCDPLTIPATCPPGAVNMTAAKGVSGRPLDPAICTDFPYSNATRPFPESFDVFTPYPYTPTPLLPAPVPVPVPASPAPALSPPTSSPPAPITGAPPPSAVSPSPPSASPPPAAPSLSAPPPSVVSLSPPSASPPPAGPSPPPPPPKAAGADGLSLAAAVLPLLAVVLMGGV
ncbi:unnamed protein product [Closterium sp. Naga37s-1]|nr:unnamed protein product [Closterium sp. Naga37s-1]